MSTRKSLDGLFYGDGFCEVAWFVDVGAFLQCVVVGEELQGQGENDGGYRVFRGIHHDQAGVFFVAEADAADTNYFGGLIGVETEK